jgi:integrase
MSQKLLLTDRFVRSPARVAEATAAGGRIEYRDQECRNLRLRVSETGAKSYVLVARFPPGLHPTRRSIGKCDDVTLEEARDTARDWRRLIRQDIDPAVQKRDAKAAVAAADAAAKAIRGTAFKAVAEVYINEHVSGLANWKEVAQMVRFLAGLIGTTPIAEVTAEQCEQAIRTVRARAAASKTGTDGSGSARRHFQLLQHLFQWARHTPAYKSQGVISNPMDDLKSVQTAGKAVKRQRYLKDDELLRVWQAADRVGYPYGRLIQLLTLTGCRRDELAEMRWSEVNLDKRLIEIPASRMKMDIAHTVPLAPMAFELVASLPRHVGDCVFSANNGRTSFVGFARAKQKLDQLANVAEPWVVHDLRRTVRSRLSALAIEEVVREHMIGHGPTGIRGVYNRYQYDAEKRRGYELYEAALQPIITANVVPLRAAAGD